MYFDSVASALSMDGHGGYVWSAYLITVAVVLALLLVPLRRKGRFLLRMSGELKRQQLSPNSVKEES